MVKCPLCHGELIRYTLRTRQAGTHIAVMCEVCEHVGPEFKLASMNDTSAALSAVQAFNTPSPKPVRSTGVFLVTQRCRLQ